MIVIAAPLIALIAVTSASLALQHNEQQERHVALTASAVTSAAQQVLADAVSYARMGGPSRHRRLSRRRLTPLAPGGRGGRCRRAATGGLRGRAARLGGWRLHRDRHRPSTLGRAWRHVPQ
jgi:hypothetical protein